MTERGWVGPVVIALILGLVATVLSGTASPTHYVATGLYLPGWTPHGLVFHRRGMSGDGCPRMPPQRPTAHAIWGHTASDGSAVASINVDVSMTPPGYDPGALPRPNVTARNHPAVLIRHEHTPYIELVIREPSYQWWLQGHRVGVRDLIRVADGLDARPAIPTGRLVAHYLPGGFKALAVGLVGGSEEHECWQTTEVRARATSDERYILINEDLGPAENLWWTAGAWDSNGFWTSIRGHRAFVATGGKPHHARYANVWVYWNEGPDVAFNFAGEDLPLSTVIGVANGMVEVSAAEWRSAFRG